MTTRTNPEALAEPLRALVAILDAGSITAGPIARAYLAGALAALEAVAGNAPTVALPDLGR